MRLRTTLLKYASINAMVPVSTLAVTIILARILSTREYGIYTLCVTAATTVAAIACQWLVQSVARFLPTAKNSSDAEMIRATAVTTAVLYISVCGLISIVGFSLTSLSIWFEYIAVASLLAGVLVLYSTLTSIYQADMNPSAYAVLTGCSLIVKSTVVVIVAVCFKSAVSTVLGAAIAGLIAVMFSVSRSLPSTVPQYLSVSRATIRKSLFRYGFPMTGWFIASNLLAVSDRYLIGAFFSPSEVGIYSSNYALASAGVSLVTAPVALTMYPALMREWSSGRADEARHMIRKIVFMLSAFGLLGTGCLVFLSHWFSLLVLGPRLADGYSIIPIVFLASVILQIGTYLHKPFEFEHRTRALFLCMSFAAATNVILNCILLRPCGYSVAAWTTLAGAVAYCVAVLLGRSASSKAPELCKGALET